MATPLNDFQRALGGQEEQPEEPQGVEQRIDAMPNSERLTSSERWIYDKLPGFSESSVGKALAKFGESPFGKALSILDVGAEGLERGLGFVSQYADRDPEEDFDFKAAWYAGSLTADVSNLPTLRRDEDNNIIGLEITEDLPGVASLTYARKRIIELTKQGVPYKEALEQSRDDYYNNLGALQLRAQINDTWLHVVGDPLNYVMPALKPVERLQAVRNLALAGKIPLDELQDALKIAEKAGNLQDVGKITGTIADIQKQGKALTTWDKFAIMATGGNPLDWKPPTTKLGKVWEKINPAALTRGSRAQEMTSMISDNIATRIISPNMDNPEEIVKALSRAAKGSMGEEYGTAFLTLEGRMAQGELGAVAAYADDLGRAYKITENERTLLKVISDGLGDNSVRILKEITDNPEVVLKRIAGIQDETIQALVRSGELNAETLGEMASVMKNVPTSPELFSLELMAKVEDIAMQQSIVRFGVEGRGLVTRWAGALKAAESMAFLRMNPGYAMRNLINNDITMIARGVFGTMLPGQIDDFAETTGLVLTRRFSQGIGMGGPDVKIASKSGQMLDEALRAGNMGAPEKIQDFFRNIDIGKVDATYWGGKMEVTASKRASVVGYIEGMRNYFWKRGKGYDLLDDTISPAHMDELRKIDPNLPRVIEDAVEATGGNPQAIKQALKENMNLNYSTVSRNVEEGLGYKLDEVFSADLTEELAQGLPKAAAEGKLDEFVLGMRTKLDQHLDDLHQKEMAELPGMTAEMVKAGGPQMFYKTIGDATDNFWAAESEHAIKMTTATDSARAAARSGDFERSGVIWDKLFRDDEKFYGRMWDRFDGQLKGLEKGAKEAGINFSPEVRQGYKNVRAEWKDFYGFRQKEYKKLRDSKNFLKDYDALKAELDIRYKKTIVSEDKALRAIDDAIAEGIENEAVRSSFTKWREYAADLRLKDKENTAEFMKMVRELEPEERAAAFKTMWKQRNETYTELWRADRIGNNMMAGDSEALAFVDNLAVKPGVQGEGANAIRGIADEYGIASATEAGRPNDRHILNTVNKFYGAEDAKKIPLGDVKNISRGQLPKHTSERMAQEAKQLSSEMFSGTGPQASVPGQVAASAGAETVPTRNVDWYKDLPSSLQKKPALDKALSKIIEDAGKDKGVNVERMKDFIMDRFTHGDPDTGTPPDLGVLMELGAPKKTMDEALKVFNEMTGQELKLNDALKVSGWRKGGFNSIDEIPEDLARAAFEARAVEKGLEVPAQSQTFIGDISKMFPDQMPLAQVTDQATYGRAFGALDGLADEFRNASGKTPSLLKDLPQETQDAVMGYLNKVQGQAGDARYAATRFSEFRRDSALLNYNRRTNFDSWVGNALPFAFWTTGSMQKWALHSIDRPAMLTNTLRMKKFLETSGLQNEGMPSRLKGQIKIKLPFTPDWAGDLFFDPIGLAMPIDAFVSPLEQYQQSQTTLDGRADRLLDEMYQNGQISQQELEEGKAHQGATWDQAKAQALQNDENLKFDAFEFTSLVSSPHAPMMWAYNAARGHTEDTGPFMPFSRTARNVATTLGIDDWNNSPLNMEAKLRKSMGLPAYDKWDDYRYDRSLSNMLADGEYTQKEVMDAMYLSSQVQAGQITSQQAQEQSEAYKASIKRGNMEFAGGSALTAIFKAVGINVMAYPTGEQSQRDLQKDFTKAAQDYRDGDFDAYNAFFEKNPEYESRLALYDKPEERMRKFMIDDLWARYNELPQITKNDLRDNMPADFQQKFLNKDTRAYDSVTPDEMQLWMKLMGGDTPGILSANTRLVYQMFGDLKLTDPETAERGQVFYDMRSNMFPDYNDMQGEYYGLPEGSQQRKDYLKKNPELKEYWDWRYDFMEKNSDLVPYLTDNEKLIKEAQKRTRSVERGAVPTADEIRNATPAPMYELLQESFTTGAPVPYVVQEELFDMSQLFGLTQEQILQILMAQP